MNSKKARKRLSKKTKSVEVESPLADRRALEKSVGDVARLLEDQEFGSVDEANAFIESMLSAEDPFEASPRTPLRKAQDLIYDAWESSKRWRVKLARKALEISEDCADAYVLLAEETARSLEEAKSLYEKGVTAGERALGRQMFRDDVGHFWGILETRPYMRARAGLAQSLWMLGKRQEAIDHYSDMLRLNPNDNQGIRYILAQCLLEIGADEDLEKLLGQYPWDAAASWLYIRALWVFGREGESKRAKAFLKQALKVNPFVPSYLLGKKKIPKRLPEYIGWGDDREAVAYAAESIDTWRKTQGALDWLTRNLP
jgi:tetratricopeptide (TPR) repeat protein